MALEYDEDEIGDLEEQGHEIRGFADVAGERCLGCGDSTGRRRQSQEVDAALLARSRADAARAHAGRRAHLPTSVRVSQRATCRFYSPLRV